MNRQQFLELLEKGIKKTIEKRMWLTCYKWTKDDYLREMVYDTKRGVSPFFMCPDVLSSEEYYAFEEYFNKWFSKRLVVQMVTRFLKYMSDDGSEIYLSML